MNQGQKGRQLYMIMTDKEHPYCLYRIEKPQFTPGEDETSIRNLGKPLFGMDGSMFPELMGFAAVDSRIFMVGGSAYDKRKNKYRNSRKVFIYDTESNALSSGPKLNSAKPNPQLITLGSKIFVLSDITYSYDSTSLDREPRFEMLDTKNLQRGWSPLPIPEFHIFTSTKEIAFPVYALAAVCVGGGSCPGGIIVLSTCDAGTYVFDVDKQVWNYVTDELLPFEGTAMSLPHDPFLCCAFSLKSQRFSAFRFCYGEEGDESNNGFQVEEIQIDNADSLSPPLPPEICYRPTLTVPGPHGLMYFVDTGVDDVESTHTLRGNRYVKVSALQFTNLNHAMKKRHIGHSEDKDETTKVGLNKGLSLRSCTNTKREMRHDEEHDETLDVGLNKATSSKRGKKKRQEEQELILTRIWRSCFFGGPVCDPLLHVVAAFAM